MKNARGYVEVLRQHIPKENDILYPMADEVIDEKEDEELFKAAFDTYSLFWFLQKIGGKDDAKKIGK